MTDSFISFKNEFNLVLKNIVSSNFLHAKWLNTLSYLENCGARKIAGCEHPILVREEMLKHAAEEFRHAHYLKSQIKKISHCNMDDYSLSNILGGLSSLNYLEALDLHASKYLSKNSMRLLELRGAAYLFVTYAIELRAQELYPLYHQILKATSSHVKVKSILLEEEEHLKEMRQGIHLFKNGRLHAHEICRMESNLCRKWVDALLKECVLQC